MGWPIVITQELAVVGPLIDMIWVGRLGAASIAGVGVAGLVIQLSRGVMMGLPTGMRALIARFVGAGDVPSANKVAQQAFAITAVFGAILTLLGIFFSGPILNLFGLKPDVIVAGVAYMRIMFIGAFTMAFVQMITGIMQASGDSVSPMRVAIFYQAIHVALAPFLILGWWVFPRLGVSGAAWANVIGDSLGLALALWFLFGGRTRLQLTMRNFHFDWNIIWRIVKIGLPASGSQMERVFTSLILMRIIIPFGTIAVAAKSLMPQLEGPFINTVNISMGRGAGVLAAQNLGARQPERAEKCGWLASLYLQPWNLALMAVMLLWPEWVIGLFSPNAELLAIGVPFLRITAVGFLMHSIHCILPACISDTGDTLPPMLISLVGSFGVAVPLAYFLPRVTNLGVYGVVWAGVISLYFMAAAYIIYFKIGAWKRRKI